MPPRKYYRKRKFLYRKKKGTKKSCKLSKCMKKEIQKLISKNVEDKVAFHSTGTSLINFNSGITSVSDALQILPAINNGSTEQHRIGDTIRAKSLVIRGYIQLQKDQTMGDVANKRIAVRLMALTAKRQKNWSDVTGFFNYPALLNKGTTNVAFNGYINDLWTPINDAEFTKLYDRVFYLSQDYVAQQVGSSTPTMTWSQDISKGIKFFTIRIPLRGKKLLYDTGISSNEYPTNFAPFMCLGYAHLDGSSPDVVETRVGICYDVNFTYEDA